MSSQYVIHAAKVPETAESLRPDQRRVRGVTYVNACDEKPWHQLPEGIQPFEVKPCSACQLIVSYQPKTGTNAAQ